LHPFPNILCPNRVIKALFEEAERTMMQGFVSTFRLEKLPKFHQKVVELTKLLVSHVPRLALVAF
jgi:hypothetical protein